MIDTEKLYNDFNKWVLKPELKFEKGCNIISLKLWRKW